MTKWLVYALTLALLGCGVSPEGTDDALELEPKDNLGKRPPELEPDELEPRADAGDAGAPRPDASPAVDSSAARPDAAPAPDSAQALPDSGGAVPDSAAPSPGDAQAAADGSDGSEVDSGAPPALAGAWRVLLTPWGATCAGAVQVSEDWTVDATGTVVTTPQGTLTGANGMYAAQWGAFQVALRMAASSTRDLTGERTRTTGACSDRWIVEGQAKGGI